MVQVRLAEDAAQGRLSNQRGCAYKIDRFDDGFARVHDPEVHDGVHLYGDVVTCDRLLSRNLQRHDAQVHLAHGFDEGDEEEQARSAGRDRMAETEDHAAFVLLHNLDRGADEHKRTTATAPTITNIVMDIHSRARWHDLP